MSDELRCCDAAPPPSREEPRALQLPASRSLEEYTAPVVQLEPWLSWYPSGPLAWLPVWLSNRYPISGSADKSRACRAHQEEQT